jgi:hypothetical protein
MSERLHVLCANLYLFLAGGWLVRGQVGRGRGGAAVLGFLQENQKKVQHEKEISTGNIRCNLQ